MCYTQNRFNALLSACVLSLIATAGWSQSLTWLGTLGDNESEAWGVSADGAVVVGVARNDANQLRAFRWENGVMQDLGTLGGNESLAWDVSADGTVVVGWAENADGQWRAFRWENGVMQDLGTLGGNESVAWGVSADGAVVVGWSEGRAFRWTESDGMEDLGTLGGTWCDAYDVSADGSVVVGEAENAAGQPRAFRWTASGGMEDLTTTYDSLLTDGSVLVWADPISPDGRYIAGYGRNAATGRNEGFLLDTWRVGDTNGDGCVDDADLLAVLFAFGSAGTGDTRHEDINKDGIVDDADLLQVLSHFGSGC